MELIFFPFLSYQCVLFAFVPLASCYTRPVLPSAATSSIHLNPTLSSPAVASPSTAASLTKASSSPATSHSTAASPISASPTTANPITASPTTASPKAANPSPWKAVFNEVEDNFG